MSNFFKKIISIFTKENETKEKISFREENYQKLSMKVNVIGFDRRSPRDMYYVMEKQHSEASGFNHYAIYFEIGENKKFVMFTTPSNNLSQKDRDSIDRFMQEWNIYKESRKDSIDIEAYTAQTILGSSQRIAYANGDIVGSDCFSYGNPLFALDDMAYQEEQNSKY